ncbi:hypothetical protein [Micromonospora sp. KC723]|uniref:hypothetical protein n=1 Tax=Micromonospora sp. KC723 TaxID=2530381 RepID=UPI00104D9B1A|nr:hypothetical protein [Micromonospora sp. KC723]TDB71717.1 hypothetical protein E1165_22270 [Micromonospora sp. KC723]
MPARRNPRKSHRAQVEVSTADLDALAVAPVTPAALPADRSGLPVATRATPTPPPSSGRSVRGGSTTARGQARRYAFRRS